MPPEVFLGVQILGNVGATLAVTYFYRVLYVACPVVAAIMAVPLVSAGPAFGYSSAGFQVFYWSITLSLVLGLAAAPGYLRAVFQPESLSQFDSRGRLWIRLSLVTALLASMWGALLTIFAFWHVAVFAVLSVLLCGRLIYLSEKRWGLESKLVVVLLAAFLGEVVALICYVDRVSSLRGSYALAVVSVGVQIWALTRMPWRERTERG